ncbi:MAG: proprotein convertase P-domain-containing protein [Pyrinomonadaceae bacterium]
MKHKVVLLSACFVLTIGSFCIMQSVSADDGREAISVGLVGEEISVAQQASPVALDSFTATPNVAIPDNTYNGALGSMACSTISTLSLPVSSFVGAAQVQIAMSHTFVCDLTIKLVSPAGSILGLVSRPGVVETADNGNDTAGFGENSNLLVPNPLTYSDSATVLSEQMGKVPIDLATGQTICVDGGTPCIYRPAPGTVVGLTGFAGFDGQDARGNWQLCIGDAAAADTGTFASWTLTLASFPTTAAKVSVSGRAVTPSGQAISNALLTLTGGDLTQPRYAKTNVFGYYKIDDLAVGQFYVLTIEARRHTFANPTQAINLDGDVAGLDFVSTR